MVKKFTYHPKRENEFAICEVNWTLMCEKQLEDYMHLKSAKMCMEICTKNPPNLLFMYKILYLKKCFYLCKYKQTKKQTNNNLF